MEITYIAARELTAGTIVDGGPMGARVTVTRARNDVNYYTRRMTSINGTNESGVLVEIMADPGYEFVQL